MTVESMGLYFLVPKKMEMLFESRGARGSDARGRGATCDLSGDVRSLRCAMKDTWHWQGNEVSGLQAGDVMKRLDCELDRSEAATEEIALANERKWAFSQT